MASNKRPSKSTGTDRPLIRSSHGGPRVKSRADDGDVERVRPLAPRPQRAEKARPTGPVSKRARPTLPKAAPEGRRADEPRARASGDDEGARLKKTKAPAGVSSATDEAREVATAIAVAALDKKASGLEVIDVAGKVDYADFLVLMSGRSDRHVTALANAIEEELRKRNKRALAVEGLPHASWVLMDFGDVVVHVFQDDARAAYDIEGLWMDARRLPVPIGEPREPRV